MGVLVTSVGVLVTSEGVLVTSVDLPITSPSNQCECLVTSVGVLVTSVVVLVTSVCVLVTNVGVLAFPATKSIPTLSGVKFVPLRTSGGELIQGSGLFVKITKETSISAAGVSSAAPVKQLRSRPHLTHQANVEESLN